MRSVRIFSFLLLSYPLIISDFSHRKLNVFVQKSVTSSSVHNVSLKKNQIKVSIGVLLNAIEMNWDEFDNFAISQGYTFRRYENDTDEITKAYVNGKYHLEKSINDIDKTSCILYDFSSQMEYSSLKKQLIDVGFKYILQKGSPYMKGSLTSLTYVNKPYFAYLISWNINGILTYSLKIEKHKKYE